MVDQEDRGPYRVLVVDNEVKADLSYEEAVREAKRQKRAHPNRHISIQDKGGLSTPEDLLPDQDRTS